MDFNRPGHLTDEDLESYTMGKRLLGPKLTEIEEHLSGCAICRARLEVADTNAATMRDMLRLLDARKSQSPS